MVYPLGSALTEDALRGFGEIALHESDLKPGSISPLLYWWDGYSSVAVSRLDDYANVHILTEGRFGAVLRELRRR